jgi:hypothetical protein
MQRTSMYHRKIGHYGCAKSCDGLFLKEGYSYLDSVEKDLSIQDKHAKKFEKLWKPSSLKRIVIARTMRDGRI